MHESIRYEHWALNQITLMIFLLFESIQSQEKTWRRLLFAETNPCITTHSLKDREKIGPTPARVPQQLPKKRGRVYAYYCPFHEWR